MPKIARELSALAVAKASTPGLLFVGGVVGLALQVKSTGAKSWLLRVVIGGRRREMGLGAYPTVTLAQAREQARAARDLIRQGIDPVERQQAAQRALAVSVAAALTFEEACDRYIRAHGDSWRNAKHRQQWSNTLQQHAYPKIGHLPVDRVDLPHVLEVLEPIWRTTNETAVRLRGRIEAVLDWAQVRGYRQGLNPARWRGHLDKLLPKPSRVKAAEHHPAVPVSQVAAFVKRLRACTGMGALALEFAILTAARSGEVRGATLEEIDREGRVWSVPGSRMKAGKDHRVPLSDAALAVLDKAAAIPRVGESTLVFVAPRGGPLSDMTLTAVMRRMGLEAVPHGFRSTFRDWAAECTDYPREVAEMALAHAIGDRVEAAYRRGDLFERRRELMRDWATFLDGGEPAAPKAARAPKEGESN